MKAELVVSTVNMLPFSVPGMIWHSDPGSLYGSEQTRTVLLEKEFQLSMNRAGTATDNGYAERFVGMFKLAIARLHCAHRPNFDTLGRAGCYTTRPVPALALCREHVGPTSAGPAPLPAARSAQSFPGSPAPPANTPGTIEFPDSWRVLPLAALKPLVPVGGPSPPAASSLRRRLVRPAALSLSSYTTFDAKPGHSGSSD